MSQSRIGQQKLLREAEGYLELIATLEDRWPLDMDQRARLADRCLDCLRLIEDQRGRRAEILFLKGQAYRLSERYEHAVDALEGALRLDTQNVPTALALGWCYKRLGRLADAVESLEHAVVIDPNLGIAHYNLACYLALIGRTKLALRHLGAAVELDGDFRDRAAHESDFDSIRNDPEFQAVISVVV